MVKNHAFFHPAVVSVVALGVVMSPRGNSRRLFMSEKRGYSMRSFEYIDNKTSRLRLTRQKI